MGSSHRQDLGPAVTNPADPSLRELHKAEYNTWKRGGKGKQQMSWRKQREITHRNIRLNSKIETLDTVLEP